MKKLGPYWLLLAAVASIQGIVALVVLSWAIPLFFDPPLLGNGISHRARELQEIVESQAAGSILEGIADHYRWLFWRHTEGVQASLLASIVLLGASTTTWVVLFLQLRAAPRIQTKSSEGR
jgi:hypothetical protein